ncbi:hypothetical protein Bca4012_040257 [Brassica carinata]
MKKLKQIVSADNLAISRPTQSSTVERQYIEPIPVDLLIDILLRVPSKSIARFRCVSKSWGNILRRPYFTELFLRKSLNHPRLLFHLKVDGKLYFFSAPQTQNTEANSSLVATRYHTHSLKGFSEIRYLLQGLVCFQYRRKDYPMTPVLCNPVTGEFITFPEVKAILHYPKLCCGYDPTYKQFKVLCVSINSDSTRAHVLTLKTGKHLWRMIECTPHHIVVSRGICIDGILYYLAYSAVGYMIVCFNVRSEKFIYIKIDDETMTTECTLVNYNGKLGGVQFKENSNLRLWLVEQDHAGKYKWSSSIYELPPSFGDFYIVGMTGTSDIVLSPYYLSDPFYVFYYNVERKALTRVEIQGFQEFKSQRPTTVYTFQDYVEDVKLMECL